MVGLFQKGRDHELNTFKKRRTSLNQAMLGSEHWIDIKVLVYRTYTWRMANASEDRSLLSPRPNAARQFHVTIVNLNSYVVGLSFRPALERLFNNLSHLFPDHLFNLDPLTQTPV
jgi:hypothetical protein